MNIRTAKILRAINERVNATLARTSFGFFWKKMLYLPGDGLVVNVNHDDLEVLVSGVLSNPVRAQNSQTKNTTSNAFLQKKLKNRQIEVG